LALKSADSGLSALLLYFFTGFSGILSAFFTGNNLITLPFTGLDELYGQGFQGQPDS